MGKATTAVAPKRTTAEKDAAAKMHRRSRSGCYTCRLRRKKCDEGKDQCKACRHLGLLCEYKRPLWWSDADKRKNYKEEIKAIIKRTKTTEKCAQQMAPMGADTLPGLSYSLPTSATYSITPDTRAHSVDESHHSPGFDFSQPPEHFDIHAQPHVFSPPYEGHPYFPPYTPAPYEVDVKTETQMYINDVPTRKDSSTSTYSTWHAPPEMTPFLEDEWVHEGIFEPAEMFGEDGPESFDFFNSQMPPSMQPTPIIPEQVIIDVDGRDKPLLDHFLQNVVPLLFPILEINRPGFARSHIILPALERNRCYLHCCLLIAAEHLKSINRFEGQEAEDELIRIRGAAVYALHAEIEKESMGQILDHYSLLDATLPMTVYKTAVGRPEDHPLEVPWDGHFQVISDLVKRLQLEYAVEQVDGQAAQTPISMTQTAWVDVLGATMKGRSPLFAPSYRAKFEAKTSSGLREMMGCDDRVMYLISEIACLDAIKNEGTEDEWKICEMITMLGRYLNSTTPQPEPELRSPILPTGVIDAVQLSDNITALFRVAARIYLVGLVPDHTGKSDSNGRLTDQLASILDYIPSGIHGFDRSLVWPLLIGGSASEPNSRLRHLIMERVATLGELGEYGSFGKMVCVLQEVWHQSAEQQIRSPTHAGEKIRNVHWRDVMLQHEGWQDLLLI